MYKQSQKQPKTSINMDNLFTENVQKKDLKVKREKLKKDRFKEKESVERSRTEEKLIKREMAKMQRKETAGISVVPRKPTSNRKYEDDEFGGELMDIWSTPAEVKSKKFDHWKNNFAKKTAPNVKAVINPKGGHSYNPSLNDHKKLLKEVAATEEKIVEANLKDLKKLRPLLYSDKKDEANDEDSNSEKHDEESSVDSSEEEIDMEKSLAVGKTVDRNDIKTQS